MFSLSIQRFLQVTGNEGLQKWKILARWNTEVLRFQAIAVLGRKKTLRKFQLLHGGSLVY